MNLRKMHYNKKGITIISLIITIVVLTILAGIIMNAVIDDNGILKSSEEINESIKIKELSESLQEQKNKLATNNFGKINVNELIEHLKKYNNITKIEEINESCKNITIEDRYVFLVEEIQENSIRIIYEGKPNQLGPRIKNIKISTIEGSINNSIKGSINILVEAIRTKKYIIYIDEEKIYEIDDDSGKINYEVENLQQGKEYNIKIEVKNDCGMDYSDYKYLISNKNAIYKVIHEKMNLDGTTYTISETENLVGVIGNKVTPEVKQYLGFTSPELQEIVIAPDGSTTLTYRYERNKYEFTLGTAKGIITNGRIANETQEGEIIQVESTPSGNYYYEQTIKLSACANSGYTFIGWTSSNENLIKSTNEANVTFKMPAENITMTPSSKINSYKISYNLNNGSVGIANPTSYNTETENFTLNNPSKEGYTFTGWTGSNGDVPELNVTIQKGSIGNREYTANWEDKTAPIITSDLKVTNKTTSSITVSIGAQDKGTGLDKVIWYYKKSSEANWMQGETQNYIRGTKENIEKASTFTGLTHNTNYDIRAEVYDVEGNTTTKDITNQKTNQLTISMNADKTEWTNTDVYVTITANGTKTYYGTEVNAMNTSYTSPIQVTTCGTTIHAYTTDGTNRVEGSHTINNIDKEGPSAVNITYKGGSNTHSWKNDYNLTLSATDSKSGVSHYEIDLNSDGNADATTGDNFIPWNGFSSCATRFRAVDKLENKGSWTNNQCIHMDTSVPTGSIIINDNASTTEKCNVTLNISATDNIEGVAQSGIYQMCVSNNGNQDLNQAGAWEAYSTTKSWNLEGVGTEGTKRVYIWFKDYAGNISNRYEDSIQYSRVVDHNASYVTTGTFNIVIDDIYGNDTKLYPKLKVKFTDGTEGEEITSEINVNNIKFTEAGQNKRNVGFYYSNKDVTITKEVTINISARDTDAYNYAYNLYRGFLARDPEDKGFIGWYINLRDKKVDPKSTAWGVAFSQESNGNSNEQFMIGLYWAVFGRKGNYINDPAVYAWANDLNSGKYTRQWVFDYFCDLPEFKNYTSWY